MSAQTDQAAGLFSAEQILTAVNDLPAHYRYDDVANLQGGDFAPEALEAFAKLARSLGADVHVEYRVTIRREKTPAKLREHAIEQLQAKAERGEIVPANLDPDRELMPV